MSKYDVLAPFILTNGTAEHRAALIDNWVKYGLGHDFLSQLEKIYASVSIPKIVEGTNMTDYKTAINSYVNIAHDISESRRIYDWQQLSTLTIFKTVSTNNSRNI